MNMLQQAQVLCYPDTWDASFLSSGGGVEVKMTVRSAIWASALALLMTASALADQSKANGGNGNHWGWATVKTAA
jgi:hypothetical protein